MATARGTEFVEAEVLLVLGFYRFSVKGESFVAVCGGTLCMCVCLCECLSVCVEEPCEYELQSEYRSVSQRLSEMAALISPNYTQISL